MKEMNLMISGTSLETETTTTAWPLVCYMCISLSLTHSPLSLDRTMQKQKPTPILQDCLNSAVPQESLPPQRCSLQQEVMRWKPSPSNKVISTPPYNLVCISLSLSLSPPPPPPPSLPPIMTCIFPSCSHVSIRCPL